MASRRTRIKGIANIPQRKKTGSERTPFDNKLENVIPKPSADVSNASQKEAIKNEDSGPHSEISKTICEDPVIKNGASLQHMDTPADKSVPIFTGTKIITNSPTWVNAENNSLNDGIGTTDELKISEQPKQCFETTLSETDLIGPRTPTVPSVSNSPVIKHVQPDIHIPTSDIDYPLPPASPSKFNRSRIKAVPRLHQRKSSFSLSESDDDIRKYGRIRNNSICSIVSSTGKEQITPNSDSGILKESHTVVAKKMNRTDHSKKIAEARKEFHKKFGTNNPEKNKLKMIDLIFYNPTTNPMRQKNESNSKLRNAESESSDPDNPVEQDCDEQKSQDSDDNVPVPQIKIGPSGEIILDETSVVVENAEVAKQKEKIQQSEIVNGNCDNGYGIYRRTARSKDWTQKETLRFYKALNIIGTDFTVMSQLFPKRSRRELKLKFKKEEKRNASLIDKATMQPCSYNFAELKREIEVEEEEEAMLQKLREDELEQKKKEGQLKKNRKRKATKDIESTCNETKQPKKGMGENENLELHNDIKKTTKKKTTTLNIKRVLSDSDEDDIDETESLDAGVSLFGPTRSGRVPKPNQRYTILNENMKITSSNLHSIVSSDNLVPGSVIIASDEGPQASYKVYMVTPDKTLTPLSLDPDILSKMINDQQSTDSANFPLEKVIENNITIPATESQEI